LSIELLWQVLCPDVKGAVKFESRPKNQLTCYVCSGMLVL
jgi:hypothetical protein